MLKGILKVGSKTKSVEGLVVQEGETYIVGTHSGKRFARASFQNSSDLGSHVALTSIQDDDELANLEARLDRNKPGLRLTGRHFGSQRLADADITITQMNVFDKWRLNIGKRLLRWNK